MLANICTLHEILEDHFDIDLNDNLYSKERDQLKRAGLLQKKIFFTSEECANVYSETLYDIGEEYGMKLYDAIEDWYDEQDWSDREFDREIYSDDVSDCEKYVKSVFDFDLSETVPVYCYDSILKMFGLNNKGLHLYSLEKYKPFGKKIGEIGKDLDQITLENTDFEHILLNFDRINRYRFSAEYGEAFADATYYQDAYGGLE